MKPIKKFIPHIVALLAFCILATVSGLLWLERASRFPLPEVGAYLGVISGIKSIGGGDLVFYTERTTDDPKFMVAAVCDGCAPVYVSMDSERFKQGEDSVLPIELSLANGAKIRLRGSRASPGEMVGRVDDLNSGERGSWQLKILGGRGPTAIEPDEKKVKLWLSLKAEVVDNENQVQEVRRRIPEMQEEIERLSSFITDKSRLQGAAEEKFQTVRTELDTVKLDLKTKQDRAKELEARLALALRVTAMGRLVSLSRESNEREGRWIESQLRASSGKDTAEQSAEASEELEAELRRGEEVIRIKEEIRRERQRILELRGETGQGAGE